MMTDADIRRLVSEEAARVADERISAALKDQHNLSHDDLTVRLKSTQHENADHLDRALLVKKLKPGVEGDVVVSVGGDAVWAPASGIAPEVFVQEDQPEEPTYPAVWIELDAAGEPSGLWGNVV